MKRNKYINSFNTTADYNNYIESAAPGFPNVALTKDDGNVHYMKTSPNDHVIYGELINDYQNLPTFKFNYATDITPHDDNVNNTFYIDAEDMMNVTTPITRLDYFVYTNKTSIKSIKKINIDTSNVTDLYQMFYNCTNLVSVNLSGCDFASVTSKGEIFRYCSALRDIYITEEATLNLLTNNLTSAGGNDWIPTAVTIHYNGTDYVWQNNAWTAQS